MRIVLNLWGKIGQDGGEYFEGQESLILKPGYVYEFLNLSDSTLYFRTDGPVESQTFDMLDRSYHSNAFNIGGFELLVNGRSLVSSLDGEASLSLDSSQGDNYKYRARPGYVFERFSLEPGESKSFPYSYEYFNLKSEARVEEGNVAYLDYTSFGSGESFSRDFDRAIGKRNIKDVRVRADKRNKKTVNFAYLDNDMEVYDNLIFVHDGEGSRISYFNFLEGGLEKAASLNDLESGSFYRAKLMDGKLKSPKLMKLEPEFSKEGSFKFKNGSFYIDGDRLDYSNAVYFYKGEILAYDKLGDSLEQGKDYGFYFYGIREMDFKATFVIIKDL